MRSKFVAFSLFVVLTAGFITALPHAAEAYNTKGMGDCKRWVGGTDDRFWLLGFLTGYNYAKNANVGKEVEADEIYKFVSKYCKENPNDDLADAMTAYITIH